MRYSAAIRDLCEREAMQNDPDDANSLAQRMECLHPSLTKPVMEEDAGFVTDALYFRLPADFDSALNRALIEKNRPDLVQRLESLRDIPREYRRHALTYGAAFLPGEVNAATGLVA